MLLIEKCLEKIHNPFLMIAVASQRVHELSIDANFSDIHKKKALIALEGIANGNVDPQKTYQNIVDRLRKVPFL